MLLQNPAPGGWESQDFGGSHKGTDYGYFNARPVESQRIVAAAPGVVESVTSNGGYNLGWGNRIVIDHGYGVKTTYNHMVTGSAAVRPGQSVAAGTYLGRMGATGKTVPVGAVHLHFELLINGTRVDPAPYFTRHLPGIPVPAAPGPGKPFPTPKPITPKEDSMTQSVIVDGKHKFTVGEEFISHNGTDNQYTITRNVNSATDEGHKLSQKDFLDYLDGMGVPHNVVDLTTGWVSNPQNGNKKEANGTWSRRREAVAQAYAAFVEIKALRAALGK